MPIVAGVGMIISLFKAWWSTMNTLLHGEGGNFIAIFSGIWGVIKGGVKFAWDAITGIIRAALKFMEGDTNGATKILLQTWKSLWADAKGVFQSGLQIIVNAVMAFDKTLLNAGHSLGSAVVTGIVNGVKNGAGAVKNAISEMVQHPITTAKEVLQINSPSRVFYDIGINVAQGMTDGIKAGTPTVTSAVDSMSKAAETVAKERLAIRTKYRNMEAALDAQEKASGTGRNPEAHAALGNARDKELTGVTIQSVIARAAKEAETARLRSAKVAADKAGTKASDFSVTAGNVGSEYSAIADAGPGRFARELARNQEVYDRVLTGVKSISGGAGQFGQMLSVYGQIVQKTALSNYTANKGQITGNQTKSANELEDKATLIDLEFGYKNAADAASYFDQRLKDLDATGVGHNDEWVSVMRTLKQLNDQITQSAEGGMRAEFDFLNTAFEKGESSVQGYAAGLKFLSGEIDDFIAKHPGSANALEAFKTEVSGAADKVDQRNIAGQVAAIKNTVTTGGDKQAAISALQDLLPDTVANSPLQLQIKSEIARLSKSIRSEADTFWKEFAKPADDALKSVFDNLFAGKHRKSAGDIFKSFVEGEGNALIGKAESGISSKFQGSLFGKSGKGNPFDTIGGLFGGRHKASSTVDIIPPNFGSTIAGQVFGGKDASKTFDKAPGIFSKVKGSLLEGASGVYTAAQALAAAMGSGGKKKKYGGLFGAIAGGIIGSFGGDWAGGATLGGQFGSMLPFADGGIPPVGVPSLGGERGPEPFISSKGVSWIGVGGPQIFTPRVPGVVLPNSALSALRGGGGNQISIQHSHVHYGDVNNAGDYDEMQRRDAANLERNYRALVPAT